MPKFGLSPEERMLQNILNGLDADDVIYRVVSVECFFEMIEEKRTVLVRPCKWEDPFEDLLSHTIVTKKAGEKIKFAVTEDFFGQCWTLKKESDGIWRNYASLRSGVRIQTTVKKLLEVIYDVNENMSKLSSFIGKVIYKTDSEIKKSINDIIEQMLMDSSGKGIAKTLLIKREEFNYEEEVRVLFSDKNKRDQNIVSFTIDPLSLIDSVLFAPKTSEYLFRIFKQRLAKKGFPKVKVTKSKLYEPFSIEVEHDLL